MRDPDGEEHDLSQMHAAAAGVLRRLIGATDPDYEDLVQSTLAQVLATLEQHRFRGECPPAGWAAVIARNVAVDAIRARSRERALFARDATAADDELAPGPLDARCGPEHLTSVQERIGRIRDAVAAVGAKKADVVIMHDLHGDDLTVVARKLRISVSAAQSRLVRGRRAIVASSQLTPPPRPPRRRPVERGES